MRKSLKFASFLNTLVRSCGAQLRAAGRLEAARRVAERLETFMRKGILAQIAREQA